MSHLARKLQLSDYLALGFGVTVGTAWLVVMDDLLQRGGSLGAVLGFAAGGRQHPSQRGGTAGAVPIRRFG